MSVEIRRGEIFWVENCGAVGSEIKKRRPAIVVSNDLCNRYSPTIEIVYMTSKPGKHLPTHVPIHKTSTGYYEGSTALCESVYTISTKRIIEDSYAGRVCDEEMAQIDKALAISLGLNTEY